MLKTSVKCPTIQAPLNNFPNPTNNTSGQSQHDNFD